MNYPWKAEEKKLGEGKSNTIDEEVKSYPTSPSLGRMSARQDSHRVDMFFMSSAQKALVLTRLTHTATSNESLETSKRWKEKRRCTECGQENAQILRELLGRWGGDRFRDFCLCILMAEAEADDEDSELILGNGTWIHAWTVTAHRGKVLSKGNTGSLWHLWRLAGGQTHRDGWDEEQWTGSRDPEPGTAPPPWGWDPGKGQG